MRFAPRSARTRPRVDVVVVSVPLNVVPPLGGGVANRVAAATVLPLCGRSAAGVALAMLAAVLHEPEDAEPAVELYRVQRDLRREEGALLGAAGELDRGRASVSEQALEQVRELGELRGMDAG